MFPNALGKMPRYTSTFLFTFQFTFQCTFQFSFQFAYTFSFQLHSNLDFSLHYNFHFALHFDSRFPFRFNVHFNLQYVLKPIWFLMPLDKCHWALSRGSRFISYNTLCRKGVHSNINPSMNICLNLNVTQHNNKNIKHVVGHTG